MSLFLILAFIFHPCVATFAGAVIYVHKVNPTRLIHKKNGA
jgi:hypothetical protein